MTPFKAPEHKATAFNCPHCHAYANQDWHSLYLKGNYVDSYNRNFIGAVVADLHIAYCTHCKRYSIWQSETMVYPLATGILPPNVDLAEDVKEDYLEAANILHKSPRGAVALLRLCVQKLCQQLGEKGENINSDIKSLVVKGLSPKIQQALDIVRVVGNNAVHPGQLDLKDDIATANKLFALINLIAQTMITEPKEIEAMFNGLPQSQLDAIAKRDKTV